MRSLKAGLKFYISSLSITMYLLLLTFLVFILLPYHGEKSINAEVATIIDVFGLPLTVFFLALDIVRDPMVTTFEISLLSSVRKLFMSRMIIYTILVAMPLLLIPLIINITSMNFYLSMLSKFLLYIAIVSIAFLVDDYKMIIFYLVTFIFIMPFAPLIIINRALMNNVKLGLFLSIFCFYFDPVVSYVYRKIFDININILAIISILFSLLILFSSYIFFSRKEFNI